MHELTDRGEAFRTTITAFIAERRDAKLKGKDDPKLARKYEYATWLADAARRVGQIQAVTHVLKATHPDARGSSLHVTPASLPARAEIGSHMLGESFAADVVGNAAALDVFKLLKLEIEGQPLLVWARAGDGDLAAALSNDAEQAQAWMQAFAGLVRDDTRPTSHTLAKQLYWLAGKQAPDDTQYHLLQPLFASSLVHHVHADIQTIRFGDVNKQARKAWRDKQRADTSYHEYRNLAMRKLGGTKPQNISQLNSERGGVNYLLASLPQNAWQPRQGTRIQAQHSAFDDRRGAFYWFGDVREHLRELAAFLKTDPPPNQDTRQHVRKHVRTLGEALSLFGASVRGHYEPGWTRAEDCQLARCEQLWLDSERSLLPVRDDPEQPEHAEDDNQFNSEYAQGDWADEVAGRFGLWLNGQLRKQSDRLVVLGETEMHYFARQAVLDVAWPIVLQRRAKAGAA